MRFPRGAQHPDWKGGRTVLNGGYPAVYVPHGHTRANGRHACEHHVVAERALGKPLPLTAVVHHWGRLDEPNKIVICQDHAYHKLLHVREKALRECGNANWRKCYQCHHYDDVANMCRPTRTGSYQHLKIQFTKKDGGVYMRYSCSVPDRRGQFQRSSEYCRKLSVGIKRTWHQGKSRKKISLHL